MMIALQYFAPSTIVYTRFTVLHFIILVGIATTSADNEIKLFYFENVTTLLYIAVMEVLSTHTHTHTHVFTREDRKRLSPI